MTKIAGLLSSFLKTCAALSRRTGEKISLLSAPLWPGAGTGLARLSWTPCILCRNPVPGFSSSAFAGISGYRNG